MNGHSDMKDNELTNEISLSPPNVLFTMYTAFVSILKLMCIHLIIFLFWRTGTKNIFIKLLFLDIKVIYTLSIF